MRPKTNSNLFGQAKPTPTKTMKKINLKPIISYILGAVLVLGGVVIAGSLTPIEADISPTMVTLQDIYNRLQTSSDYYDSTPDSHTISTLNTPSESMATLQAIWNSLTDLRLPTEDKVQDGYSYGPGDSMTGSLSAGAPTLEWSADLGTMIWADAVTACTTWGGRLPKLGELLNVLSQQFVEGGTEGPGGFAASMYYWSSTEGVSGDAYNGSYGYGIVSYNYVSKSIEYLVRCVR